MPGATDLYDALEEFRQVCLLALADTPDGAPGCSYVAPGPPPWDVYPCLIVYSSGPAIADTFPLQPQLSPGHRASTYGQVNLVSITAAILRCAWEPGDGEETSIDPEGISAVARQTSADIWAIWNHVRAAKRAGTLFAPSTRELFVDPAVAINQQGGAAGWQFNVRTSLDGYPIGPV